MTLHAATPSVIPCLLYDDVPAAARWLCETLGFREMVRATLPDGWVGHSELERDGYIVLLGRRTDSGTTSVSTTQVFVADVAATCAVLAATGGEIVETPVEQIWEVRQAVVVDPGVSGGCSPSTCAIRTPRTGSARCSSRFSGEAGTSHSATALASSTPD